MREIHKKINTEYFDLIASGTKTFEHRINDFSCEPGDILVLEEWVYENGYGDTEHRRSTGREIRRKVGYVGKTSKFDWLDRPDVCASLEQHGAQIISLLPLDANQESSDTATSSQNTCKKSRQEAVNPSPKIIAICGSLKFCDEIMHVTEFAAASNSVTRLCTSQNNSS